MQVTTPMSRRPPRRVGNTNHYTRDIAHGYRRELGDYFKQLRVAAGLLQRDTALALGMRDSAISGIESGRLVLNTDRYEDAIKLFKADPVEFMKFHLRYTNPWIYAGLFGADKALKADLAELSKRLKDNRE